MGDGSTRLGQARQLGILEEDPVRQPNPVVQPAHALQIVERTAAEPGLAERGLVPGLGQMGVQAHVVAGGEGRRLLHQGAGDGEGRAGCQRDLHHGAGAGLVVSADQPLAVGEDAVLGLHHALGRQAAIVDRPGSSSRG